MDESASELEFAISGHRAKLASLEIALETRERQAKQLQKDLERFGREAKRLRSRIARMKHEYKIVLLKEYRQALEELESFEANREGREVKLVAWQRATADMTERAKHLRAELPRLEARLEAAQACKIIEFKRK